jgi:hypothetical protein
MCFGPAGCCYGFLPARLVGIGVTAARKRSHERSEILTANPAYGFGGIADACSNCRRNDSMPPAVVNGIENRRLKTSGYARYDGVA